MLQGIIKGQIKKPACILLYGVEGVGKSTFAAGAEKPIFIGGENNDELTVDRFPKLESYEQFIGYLRTIAEEDHDYKTLVLDTVDSIESLLWKDIRGNSSMAVALGGFGKAYEKSAERLETMRDELLEKIRNRGLQIVLLAHSSKNKFEDPITNLSYDTYEVKLHKKARPVFFEWVSAVLFANFETIATNKDGGKEYAIGDGKRLMFTSKRPAYEAKNRFNLPHQMPLTWKAFKEGFDAFYASGAVEDVGPVVAEIMELIKNNQKKLPMSTAILTQVDKANGNISELYRIKDKILSIVGGN